MFAPITGYNTPLRPVPNPKSKLLLVADSPERLKALKAGLADANFEITCAESVDELRAACRNHHDLAAVDVEAINIKPMLSALRASAGHKAIMLLVESSKVGNDPNLAGVLPTFRAMPCDRTQMLALMHLFNDNGRQSTATRPVLL
jgi:DNA-binding NtrC family response regulator